MISRSFSNLQDIFTEFVLLADMQLGYEISTPQEINEKLEAQDIDKCGYKIIIDCTGNPVAVERVSSTSNIKCQAQTGSSNFNRG